MHDIITRRYVRRPDAVEAIQLTNGNVHFIANWCGGKVISGTDLNDPSRSYLGIDLKLIYGNITRVNVGSYIIRELSGRFITLTNEEFIAEYNPESAVHRLQNLEAEHVKEMQNHKFRMNNLVLE